MRPDLDFIRLRLADDLSDPLPAHRQREVVQWVATMHLLLEGLRDGLPSGLEPLWHPAAEDAGPDPAPPGGSGRAAPGPADSGADPADLSLAALSAAIRGGAVSPVEAVEGCLARIERRNPELNAFLTVTGEQALEEAEGRAAELAAGRWRGPLHGVPVALKDLVETAGVRTTAGSRVLADWTPEADATLVRRLREAGAIIVGKTHLHEFAFGATSMNDHYGPSRNPHDPRRLTGGSSGGSAAAVAAGMCAGAIGSDTGGSIRCPAALCGVVGLKPTYGRVSRAGVIPLAWSLDHLGPLTRTVTDAALMLEAIAGPDPADATTGRRPVPHWAGALDGDVRGLRVGVPREFFWDGVQEGVADRCREALAQLAERGAEVREVPMEGMKLALAAQNTILCSEATAYHRRGIAAHAALYGEGVLTRLAEGLFLTAADYLDAQRGRRMVRENLLRLLDDVDVLATPTVPITASEIGQARVRAGDVEAPPQYYLVRFTFLFNLTGLPALTVPCGRADGLPVGLQIVGRPWDEATVLQVGHAVEAGMMLA